MSERKLWVIEEVENEGEISQRQSTATFTDNGGDDWNWNRPDEILSDAGKEEWDFVMLQLSDVDGVDYRSLLCGVGLKDWCLKL